MNDITVREATEADVPAIVDIFVRTRSETWDWMPEHPSRETMEDVVPNVFFRRCDIYLAEVDGRHAGYLGIRGTRVDHLYVLPEYQGKEVGLALLNHAKKLLPKGFDLWVFTENRQARAFYEKHGLVPAEDTNGAGNRERLPDVRYEWCP